MAPKKTVDGKTPASTKKAQDRKVKIKQLKPKLKTPSIIKVKIPITGVKTVTCLSAKPTRTVKLTKKQQLEQKTLEKLDLANEVAAAQLGKLQIQTDLVPNETPKVPKKRGRKKKVVEPVVTSADSEDAFEASPAKKKCTQKETTNPRVLKKITTPVKTNGTKKSFSLSLTPKKNVEKTVTKAGTTKTAKTTDALKKKPRKAVDGDARTRKSKLISGTGKKVDDAAANNSNSPSILDKVDDKILLGSPKDPNIEPRPIDSRKTSLNSELSWTKDISSSSTTTCFTVRSTDFVRIDKKLPLMKLEDIRLKKIETNNNFSSSTSESSTVEPAVEKADRESPELESRSLDLSTSSVTPTKSLTTIHSPENSNEINNEIDKTTKVLNKLTDKLKEFDLEIINWIGYNNDDANADIKRFQGKIFQVLKEESEVISCCQQLKRVLSNNNNIEEVDDINMETDRANDLVEGCDLKEDDVDKDHNSPKYLRSEDEENNFTSDKVKYKSFDQSCDDDDALSLFAESLTGMEASTHNSYAGSMCNPADFEEYVPQMVTKDTWVAANKFSYTPSNIPNGDKPSDIKAKTVCEKQNADSTSIYKDNDTDKDTTTYPTRPNPAAIVNQNPLTHIRIPKLMAYYYKLGYGQRSNVLRGYCFFNLVLSCKKPNCLYPHVIPDNIEITAKLVRLSEEMFIKEYMLLREWPELRRKYGMCFVEECKRRDLTRILVEMAKDFVMKANENVREDAILKVEVIECALLHLNTVDFSLCEDLLMYNVQVGLPLCDIFMQAIANTLNFSRFKPVFMKLTKFMLHYERTFSLEVATQILERLSILPCERPLLETLLEMVKQTDRKILENSMMGHLEKQLSVHKDLHEQLLELKKVVGLSRPVLSAVVESPRVAPEVEPAMTNVLMPSEREKRYTSPDTTNLDNLNKATDEPVVTQTIEFNRTGLFGGNIKRTFSNSNTSSNGSEEFRPTQNVLKNKPNYKSWRDMSIFSTIRARSPIMRHMSPRGMIGRLVHQPMNFGRSPPVCIFEI